MKKNRKILITVISAISALCAYAADDLDINSNGANITGSINNINFTENGAVGTVSGDTTLNGNIIVGNGVNATITQGVATNQIRATSNATLSGAGQENSSLTLQNFSIDGGYAGGNPSFAYDISVKDLSVNLQRNNTSGVRITGNSVLLENSVITAKNKVDGGSSSASDVELRTGLVSLSNSKLIVDSGATLKIGRDDSSFSGPVEIALNNSSLVNNGGKFAIRRPSGGDYNLLLSGSNEFAGANYTWTNTSFANGASLNLATTGQVYTLGAIALADNGSATISGKGTAKWTNKVTLVANQAFTVMSNVEASQELVVNGASANLTIGNGTDGITYKGAIQNTDGSLIINDNVTINGTFQVIQSASQTKNVYIGNNSIITSKYSRITDAEIHGRIITNATSMTSKGWNYSLAFGAFSATDAQKGDVVLGANSSVYVAPTNSTYFGIYGKLEVNTATSGALESTANAPLMIYKDSTVILNTTDAFAVGGAENQATSDFNFYAGHSNILLDVNANNNIGRIVYGDTNTLITIDIADGKVLTVGKIGTSASLDGSGATELVAIKLVDGIGLGEFRITGMDAEMQAYLDNGSSNAIVFYDESGNMRVLGENLLLVDNGDYWSIASVPEPSTYAMILGALALGFAVYRRRK